MGVQDLMYSNTGGGHLAAYLEDKDAPAL